MKLSEPKTKIDFKQYYRLRWKILRKPWKQPPGSEKDDLDDNSIHRMVINETGKIIGCGRLHFNSKTEAQIRYMAVDNNFQRKGVGSKILESLEATAKMKDAEYIILNSRDNTAEFYQNNGYRIVSKGHTLFGSIAHYRMKKNII